MLFERAMTKSGIIQLKHWLQVSPEEQARHLSKRIADGLNIGKLSPEHFQDSYSKSHIGSQSSSIALWEAVFMRFFEHTSRRLPVYGWFRPALADLFCPKYPRYRKGLPAHR